MIFHIAGIGPVAMKTKRRLSSSAHLLFCE